jgi:protein-disulfide isomerase
MSKRFLAIVVACLIALFGVYALTSKKDNSSDKTSSGSKTQLSNHVMGQNQKKVTLVEYGDYQCPACGQYYPIVKQVTDTYQKDIQFQFRNFPLQSIHPNARAGARAAEAAGKQGKYWEMHDLLYSQQDSWSGSTNAASIFEGYAAQLHLNLAQFKTDFASEAVNSIITNDLEEGNRLGITGTPTFFLQGKKIDNPQSLDGFKKVIDQAIKDANKK